jgi:copper chaperone CopZ
MEATMSDKKFELKIEGMSCGGCVRRVTAALKGIEGVDVAAVNVGTATGFFDDDDAALSDLVTAVDKLGFKATANIEQS